jgi:preprotein translocase subunit SecA
MGLWAWLTGKPKEAEVVDRIWKTQEAKFDGLCKELHEKLLTSGHILVVAHFSLTLDRLRSEFAKRSLVYRNQEDRMSPSDIHDGNGETPASVTLVQAQNLVPDAFSKSLIAALPPLLILVAERHFLRSYDDKVVEFARSLARRCRLSFHFSLDDPLMQIFAGEWVKRILTGLGMTDAKPIESSAVSRRIKTAQKKLQKQVVDERKADSAEEWRLRNLPGRK